ncbi:hypothetical protein JCM11641_002262 [Rhodosporidiobolus odoratus]
MSSNTLPSPQFSFIHVLQLVQPVSPASPYLLPALPGALILPSRLSKTAAPFPVQKPTNLDALYQLAAKQRTPEELKKDRNRKKKERKERSKAKRELEGKEENEEGAGEADAEAVEGDSERDGKAVVAASTLPSPSYGLPLDVPAEFFTLFEAHYHRLHHIGLQQRSEAWKALNNPAINPGADVEEGKEVEEPVWGNIILHDAEVKRGKRDGNKGGFSQDQQTGRWDFHWVV